MPFAIPSLPDLSKRIYGYIRARVTGTEPELWPNNLRIIGKTQAMALHEADLRAQHLHRQIFTTTADPPYLGLHAYEHGVEERPAAAAKGALVFPATPAVTFTAGLRFARADGAIFASTASATSAGNSVAIEVEAEEPGVAGNTPAGATFVPLEPIPELGDEGEAAPAGLGGGADGESSEELRARILFRKRNRPRGGKASDYVEWVTEVSGFVGAFVKGWAPGAGAVSVYPLKVGSGAAAIPSVSDLAVAAAHIELKRPLTAQVFLLQASPRPIDYVIGGLHDDTTDVRAEIIAELDDMHDERAVVALPNEPTTFSKSWADEAISSAIGESRHVLTSPAADVALAPGEYPVRGTVTFV